MKMLHWLFGRGGMKRDLLLPFACLIFVGLFAEWLVDRSVSRGALIETADSLLIESAERVHDRVAGFLGGAIAVAEANASLVDLTDAARLRLALWRQLRSRTDVDILSIGFANGEYVEAQRLADGRVRSGYAGASTGGALVLARTDDAGSPVAVELRRAGYDPRLRPWYAASARAGRPSWSAPYSILSNGELALSAGVPAFAGARLAAVATAVVRLERLAVFLREAASVPGSVAIIVDGDSRLVAASSGEWGAVARAAMAATRSRAGEALRVRVGADRYRAVQLALPGDAEFPLRLVMAFPEASFLEPLRRTDRLSLVVLAASLALSLAFAFKAARRVSQPLSDLGAALSSMEPGLGLEFPDLSGLKGRGDEIGRLAAAFCGLSGRLAESFASLKASVIEKEILLKEINHRVKNNLQVVSSLINCQVRSDGDRATNEGLARLQERIQAMIYVHEGIYCSENVDSVDMDRYFERIGASFSSGFDADGRGEAGPFRAISVEVERGGVELAIDQALPCGLIANELVANCFKHAFAGRTAGRVTISLRGGEAEGGARSLLLVVADDGIGWPGGGSAGREGRGLGSGGMGSFLVSGLASQLYGRISIESEGGGTAATLWFPAQGASDAPRT